MPCDLQAGEYPMIFGCNFLSHFYVRNHFHPEPSCQKARQHRERCNPSGNLVNHYRHYCHYFSILSTSKGKRTRAQEACQCNSIHHRVYFDYAYVFERCLMGICSYFSLSLISSTICINIGSAFKQKERCLFSPTLCG